MAGQHDELIVAVKNYEPRVECDPRPVKRPDLRSCEGTLNTVSGQKKL